MPIVNLTTTSAVGSGLPRIAKLHKGDKKTDPNRPGKDLEYFRIEFESEFADLREEWEALYGTEPDGFEQVFMTYATVDEAFATWKEEWNASATMLHRCDGEHQAVWYSQAAQAYSTSKEKCAAIGPTPCACKNVGRLNLLIPEFIQETGILGYVMVETHSINDILTVYRTLADVQRIAGTLLGVPFSLGRSSKKISAPDTKNNRRIKVNKSLFYLHVDPDFTRETLLPRLASTGGFLSAHQPQVEASVLPKLEPSLVKNLLGSGGTRRIGEVELPFELPPQPYTDDEPEPQQLSPTKVEPPQAVSSTPSAPAKSAPEQTIIGLKTVGSHLGELKTRALKEIFKDKIIDMNHCISDLLSQGKLPPALTIEQALEVVKAANCPQTMDEPAQPIAVTQSTAAPARKIDCPTHLLEPGDIILQEYKPLNGGTVETRYEVVENWGKVGTGHKLVLKNVATGKTETVNWPGGDKTLCDGPKVRAYAQNPEVCLTARAGGRPVWDKQTAEPVRV